MLTPEQVNAYAGLMAAPWEELNDRILADFLDICLRCGNVLSLNKHLPAGRTL